MLGEKITDTDGVENGGSVRGMGLLPMETEFKTEKTRTIVNGVFENMTGTLKALTALNLRDMKFIWVKVNLVSLI